MLAGVRTLGPMATRPSRGRVFPVEPTAWLDAARVIGGRDSLGRVAMDVDGHTGPHPLADVGLDRTLEARRSRIESAFADIEPTLERLAHEAIHERSYSSALAAVAGRWSVAFDPSAVPGWCWARPLAWGEVYAHCVLASFTRLVSELKSPADLAWADGEPAEEVVARFGFHAIDIVPCADGRLAGLTEHVLRIPRSVITSLRSYAGAMFDVDEAIGAFRAVEVQRLHRRDVPAASLAETRFLKVGVYHFSGSQPHCEGCAAHGSDDGRAMRALLDRLEALQGAIKALHGVTIAILLVGVDTDHDAIRVHVPDAQGRVSTDRFVSSVDLMGATRALPRDAAKALIRDRVAACAGVAADDRATEGMRWLCGYLIKNNIGQVEAVHRTLGPRYPDLGHAERLIVAGDPIDEVQLRNLAFQTQFTTLEEGARDIEVGLSLLGHTHAPRGLAVPVLATARYVAGLPGARERAAERAVRHARAIESRHGCNPQQPIVVRAAVVDGEGGIDFVTPPRLSPCARTVNEGQHA